MIKTYKRKLILNKSQKSRLDSWISTCRFVYNMALEIQIQAYRINQKKLHKYELMKQLTSIKDVDWIADVPAESLQDVIERLHLAYETFFRTFKMGGGLPKFAKKNKYNSILFKYIKVGHRSINIPKIGKLKFFNDSVIIGNPKVASIIKESSGYFVCIKCEGDYGKINGDSQAIGLDMGVSRFYTDSNGFFVENPKHFKKYENKLRVENRSLSRKKKGSNGWKKQVKKLSLLYYKISNVRKDFLHKESTKIAKSNSVVYLEDLNIVGMSKNRSLSKRILDCGWGIFSSMLEYKTTVIKVNPRYTSQTCFDCGSVDKKSRVSQSSFVCTNCGSTSNADANAAKNILSKGIALSR